MHELACSTATQLASKHVIFKCYKDRKNDTAILRTVTEILKNIKQCPQAEDTPDNGLNVTGKSKDDPFTVIPKSENDKERTPYKKHRAKRNCQNSIVFTRLNTISLDSSDEEVCDAKVEGDLKNAYFHPSHKEENVSTHKERKHVDEMGKDEVQGGLQSSYVHPSEKDIKDSSDKGKSPMHETVEQIANNGGLLGKVCMINLFYLTMTSSSLHYHFHIFF